MLQLEKKSVFLRNDVLIVSIRELFNVSAFSEFSLFPCASFVWFFILNILYILLRTRSRYDTQQSLTPKTGRSSSLNFTSKTPSSTRRFSPWVTATWACAAPSKKGWGVAALEGTYINGFYESAPIIYGEKFIGFAENKQTILNLANAKVIRLSLDGEEFNLLTGKILSYRRCPRSCARASCAAACTGNPPRVSRCSWRWSALCSTHTPIPR